MTNSTKERKVQDVQEVVKTIQKSAKTMPEVRVCPEMKVGQFARQGDIYVELVESASKGKPMNSRQLAPGTSKGSRHIVQDLEGVKVFESTVSNIGNRARFQIGPVIEADKDFCITHPEHAWMKLKKGVYQVWYQLDFSRKQKVQD